MRGLCPQGRVMTAREKKKLGLFKLPPQDSAQYANFLPLHQLWTQYMRDLLEDVVRKGPPAAKKAKDDGVGSGGGSDGRAAKRRKKKKGKNAQPEVQLDPEEERRRLLRRHAANQLHSVEALVLTADLHGAVVCVKKSRCPNYVGIEGIVVQETQQVHAYLGHCR
jgi:hypothetical protein